MPEHEREPRWHAGAIGRIPDDDSLVYRDDAVYGPQFYAATPAAAEEAARILNEMQDKLDELDPCPDCKGVGRVFPLDTSHYLIACPKCNPGSGQTKQPAQK